MNESPPPPKNRSGVVGCTLSVIGFCLCGLPLLTIPGLIISLVGLRREPKTAAIVGAVLGGIGIIEFLFVVPLMLALVAPRIAALSRSSVRQQAQIECQTLHRHVDLYIIERPDGSLPDDFQLSELTQGADPYLTDSNDLIDPWGNLYFIVTPGVFNIDFDIMSVGPDSTLGTDDDISSGLPF